MTPSRRRSSMLEMPGDDFSWGSVAAITAAIGAGRVSAKSVVDAALARIREYDPLLNSFTAVTEQRALARASALDAARVKGEKLGPLAGVPFAVKNLFDVAGLSTLAGSKINRELPPAARDATLVERLEAAGAVLVGALNMGEYAYDFTGENSHDGPSRNPHDLKHMSGGSSGGSAAAVAGGLIPSSQIVTDPAMLYIAIGILGATVMPHNLYLHSAIVQTRKVGDSEPEKRQAIRYAVLDSTVALLFAFFINAAILILAAAAFHTSGHQDVAEIGDAHRLLTPLLGTAAASTLFALALLASGQNSSVTGTLAGQIVMEGFLNIRVRPWLRRLATRAIAIVPAVVVIQMAGESGVGQLLILSQVVLSMNLPFAIIPLIHFTSNPARMGMFANKPWVKLSAWTCAVAVVAAVDVKDAGSFSKLVK